MIKLLTFIISIIYATPCFAGVYWVDSNGGAANWAACQGADPGAGNRCGLSGATGSNINATAGDTVYLMSGTYTSAVSPCKTGTTTDHIWIMAYPGQTPIIDTTEYAGIALNSHAWINVNGIKVVGAGTNGIHVCGGANHIKISNCETDGEGDTITTGLRINSYRYTVGTYTAPVTHIWVVDSTFGNHGVVTPVTCQDDGGSAYVGSTSTDDTSSNITIEGCRFYNGGHHTIETYTTKSVYRNNVFQNPGWMDAGDCHTCVTSPRTGKYSNRAVQLYASNAADRTNVLFEGNRLGPSAPSSDGGWEGNIAITSAGNIVRYTKSFYSEASGLFFKVASTTTGWANRVYNNTFYANGQDANALTCTGLDGKYGVWAQSTAVTANTICNNILWYNASGSSKFGTAFHAGNTVFSNWDDRNADPVFLNVDVSDYTSRVYPTLALSTNSGAKNAGSYLTLANGSGAASTTLVVDDAWFFQDGTWGASMSGLKADWVAVGTVGNVAQISSIDYSTHTITLASALTWADNAPVWLYKKSDGVRVLYGSAPDIGADEYNVDLWNVSAKKMRSR